MWGGYITDTKGRELFSFLEYKDMVLLNDGTGTRCNPSTLELAPIDLSFCNSSLAMKYTWSVDLTSSYGSDHHVVNINFSHKQILTDDSESVYNYKKADWEAFSSKCNEHLSPDMISDNIEETCSRLTNKILQIAGECIPVKLKNNKPKKPQVPWWTPECTKSVKERNICKNRAQHTGFGTDFTIYREKERACRKTIKAAQAMYWESYCNSLNNDSKLSDVWKKKVWFLQKLPSEWKHSIISPVLKPGKNPTDPQSYRPIALTSNFVKIMEKMNGTPQGSCISPTLFNIMVNDISNNLKYCAMSQFADDSAIWLSGKSNKYLQKRIQEDIDTISTWCDKWGFLISQTKTVAMIFTILLSLYWLEEFQPENTVIFVDSLSALKAITGSIFKVKTQIIYDIQYIYSKLSKLGLNIILEWIPSHVGLSGNEMADTAAKKALSIETCITSIPLYKEDIKCLCKNLLKKMWQQYWENNTKSKQLHTIQNDVNFCITIPKSTRERERTLFKLRSSYIFTNKFKYTMGKCNSELCDTCLVVDDMDDMQHYLFNCRKYIPQRQKMMEKFESSGVKDLSYKNLFSGYSQTLIPIWDYLINTGMR
ncbi:Hypothetical predicted protein [Mytilus galloprovincialis]|uniref:RNase H type-1 domain-containing protein n=1 Tax=Mytilus galloprovincialis TaxID=29158 RepID=A0A8B6EC08_MYTGA|nr:Hypothetical predicted protein [Mytilus galloprovincialis]